MIDPRMITILISPFHSTPDMSNASNGSVCDLTDTNIAFGHSARLFTGTIITPLYFIFGLSGRLISLLALHSATKFEGAYLYQAFVLISGTCEVITFTGFVFTYYLWAFSAQPGAVWFRKCYACMWYAAYVANPLQNTFMSTTLILTLATTADRILALAKPFTYRTLHHRSIQWAVLTFSIISSALTSLVFVFIFDLTMDGDLYKLQGTPYDGTFLHVGLLDLHNIFKSALAILLFVGNFLLLYLYQKRKRETARLKNKTSGNAHETQLSKTLFRMTLCQSVLNTVGVFANVTYHMFEVTSPRVTACWQDVLAAVVDGVLEVADILEFYVLLAICKRFRVMVWKALKNLWSRCIPK